MIDIKAIINIIIVVSLPSQMVALSLNLKRFVPTLFYYISSAILKNFVAQFWINSYEGRNSYERNVAKKRSQARAFETITIKIIIWDIMDFHFYYFAELFFNIFLLSYNVTILFCEDFFSVLPPSYEYEIDLYTNLRLKNILFFILEIFYTHLEMKEEVFFPSF